MGNYRQPEHSQSKQPQHVVPHSLYIHSQSNYHFSGRQTQMSRNIKLVCILGVFKLIQPEKIVLNIHPSPTEWSFNKCPNCFSSTKSSTEQCQEQEWKMMEMWIHFGSVWVSLFQINLHAFCSGLLSRFQVHHLALHSPGTQCLHAIVPVCFVLFCPFGGKQRKIAMDGGNLESSLALSSILQKASYSCWFSIISFVAKAELIQDRVTLFYGRGTYMHTLVQSAAS